MANYNGNWNSWALQARLVELDTPRRLENLQKLDELKKHLMDLEKHVSRITCIINYFFNNKVELQCGIIIIALII